MTFSCVEYPILIREVGGTVDCLSRRYPRFFFVFFFSDYITLCGFVRGSLLGINK